MRKTITLLATILATNFCFSQNVHIPDANFKAALLAAPNSGIDTNNDGEIQVSEAIAYTDPIDVSNKNINDLTGIEAFVNIKILACSGNNLTKLNISQNTSLERLFCMYNQIEDLSIHNNPNITLLYCYNNSLKRLNASNGNNSNITIFNAINNPNLRCINIDRGFTAPSNWAKDATASFSSLCRYVIDAADPDKSVFNPSIGGLGDPLITNEDVTMYPNPTKDILSIKNSKYDINKIEIYNLNSVKVLESSSETINISKLPKGIYTIRIVTDKSQSILRKFIKE